MVEVRRRILFLSGAPLSNSLTWEEDKLSTVLQPCFFENHKHAPPVISNTPIVGPSWRSLPLEQPHLPTGLTQASREVGSVDVLDDARNDASFLSMSDLSFQSANLEVDQGQGSTGLESDRDEILSQYYEHSFALHEDIPSSQILGPGSVTEDESFVTEPEEFSTAFTVDSDFDMEEYLTRSRLMTGGLNDLKDMPNAAYLHSINPQTVTVKLLVGIISISQPRTIKTRRGGREVELVEILAGDETRAGFGINIWLPPLEESNNTRPMDEHLRNNTLRLRPRDIVLAKQVALCSFRGKVYGQSLRRGMTTLNLLYRNVVDKDDRRGAFEAKDFQDVSATNIEMLKVKKVRDWVMRFVGSNAALPTISSTTTSRLRRKAKLEALPNDTP